MPGSGVHSSSPFSVIHHHFREASVDEVEQVVAIKIGSPELVAITVGPTVANGDWHGVDSGQVITCQRESEQAVVELDAFQLDIREFHFSSFEPFAG